MLTLNTSLKSKSGKEVTILEHIRRGGRADVYAVSDDSGTLKALKWFRKINDGLNSKVLDNIMVLSQTNAPDPHML